MNKHTIIMPPTDKAPVHSSSIAKWMWYFTSPYKRIVCIFLVYRFIRYTVLAMFPVIIGYIIDGLETGTAQDNPEKFWTILGVFFVFYTISIYNAIFIIDSRAYEKASRGLTLYGIKHLNKLSLSWHEREGSGGKLQRIMTARRGYQELCRYIRWDAFPLLGSIGAIGVTYVIIDLPLILIPFYFLFIISYLFCSWYFARNYFNLYDKFNKKFERLLSGVYEFVSSIRTVKAFHLSSYIEQRAQGLEEEGQEAVIKAYHTNLVRWTICNFVGTFWIFLFAGYGFYLVLEDQMGVGVYAAAFFLANRIWDCCEVIGSILEKIYEYGNGMKRAIETFCVKPKNFDLTPAENLPKNWKNIHLENINFSYNEDDTQGVKDISINVTRGEKIAFVGNSGAGKSTLVKLIMKQMLANNGSFRVDDTEISHVPTKDWINQIGFVPQDIELFNLSIRDNILIDRDNIDAHILEKILNQSALNEFIDSLPEGLDTIIGERGIKLSGGQRQRLGIARALVRQAPILIFDEATSSLDSISEQKIQQAIESSFEDRTVFVIAHRLSTIRNVDRIIVLDEGRIIEEGNFEALIKQNGHFAKLWSIQSQKEFKPL